MVHTSPTPRDSNVPAWLRQQELQNASLEYADLGWRVFPIHQPVLSDSGIVCGCHKTDCNKAGKHPCISNFLKRATTSESAIHSWWDAWPGANIGVVTGRDSGIIVLDIDKRTTGIESLEKLVAKYGPLPRTVKSLTGGGGCHYYFRHPGGSVWSSDFAFGSDYPGIDLRAEKGCVIAPPSLHAAGEYYRWADDLDPRCVELAELPRWILELVQKNKRQTNSPKTLRTSTIDITGTIPEGYRNDTLFRVGCGFSPYCYTETELFAHLNLFNNTRCDPPVPGSEVKTIAHSVYLNRNPTPDELLRIVWTKGVPLNPQTKAVLSVLILRSNWTTWRCFPSHETIAADAGMGKTATKGGLNTLRSFGFISWEKRQRSNHYEVDVQKILSYKRESDASVYSINRTTIPPLLDSSPYPTTRHTRSSVQTRIESDGSDPPET